MNLPGLDPQQIHDVVESVPEEHVEYPDKLVKDPEARIRAAAPEIIKEWWGDERSGRDYFTWEDSWRRLDYEVMARAFSEQELIRLWIGSAVESKVSTHFKENRRLLDRLNNCLWQYGCCSNINKLSQALEGLKRLRVELPDFEARVTYSWGSYSTSHYSEHIEDLYLDAMFGLLLFYKGRHVLTCSFAPSRRGVLITQIQLRSKKGNRFLYKLGKHYQDFCLDRLGKAFGDDQLWLVEGASAVAAIHRAYGKKECGLTGKDDERIEAFYNRALSQFTRGTEETSQQGRRYLKLHSRLADVYQIRCNQDLGGALRPSEDQADEGRGPRVSFG